MKRFGIEPAPLILAFVLGPMLENNLSKALIMSRSSGLSIFLTRPISGVLLVLTAVVLVAPLIQSLKRAKSGRPKP